MRFADWLLRHALRNDDEREMVLGDLHEELPRRGAAWYRRQALAIAAHALFRRKTAPVPRSSGDFFMRIFLNDVKYAWRSLGKRPLLTLTVAATLALGLGANAAIFNLIDRMVLRPFPALDPDNVVMIAETGPKLDYRRETVSPANFLDWRKAADTVTHLSAFLWWDANLLDGGEPERVQGTHVSAGFFDALGMRPALGRGFVHEDETFGRHFVVVITDALWKRRFDADPSIVGRRVIIDGQPHEIVGVAPHRFAFPDGTDIWAPLAFDPARAPSRDRRYLTVIGRVKAGRTFADVETEMRVLGGRLARDYPDANRDHGTRVDTLTRGMLDEGSGPLLALWQASAFVVLLIACANIANLMLARAAERRREMAVRLALGASRIRIVRELLTESTMLALLAVPGALGFAWICLYLMRISMPARILRFAPGFETLGPDLRLLGFTLALALLTAGIFGLLPAFQAARSRVADALKEGGRSATGRQLLRRAIVVAQLSIALPLLVASGIGVIGTNRLLNGPQGYDPDGLLTMKLFLPERNYPDDDARRRFVARALDGVAAVPGVQHATVANSLPASGSNAAVAFEIDGQPVDDWRNLPTVDNRTVGADHFATLRIPLKRGRGFSEADRDGAAFVAVISESMAAKYWPGADPLGRRVRVRFGASKAQAGPWITVVGVSGDIIQDWFNRRNVPTMYRPVAQVPTDYFGIAVRTPGDATAVAGAVRQALLKVDATQPVFEMMPMRQVLHERTIGLQYLAAIMTVFGGLALFLAAVGLYAVIAYLVAQRRHEIGLRIALGASRRNVIGMTVGQALKLTLLGSAIGLGIAIALTRVLESAMLGIAEGNPLIFAGFAAVLMGAALLAGYLPARRAASIDPMIVMRSE